MSKTVAVTPTTLMQAASLLRQGGVVAFPTETYYGLAVDPWNTEAVERLYRIKKRARQLPVLVLISGQEQVMQVAASLPAAYQPLMNQFWPGPLTLICPARHALRLLTGGTGTIGVRHSPHPVAAQLLVAFGGPVTATSANLSRMPAAVSAAQVEQMLAAGVDLILDGGDTPGGSGSTLVGLCDRALCCLREGKIPFSQIQEAATASASSSFNA